MLSVGRVRDVVAGASSRFGAGVLAVVFVLCGQRPRSVAVGEAEHGEARPVDGSGSRVDVGSHACEAAGSRSSPSPRAPNEMRDLAFDEGAVGAVARSPLRCRLLGPGPLK